MKEGPNFCCLEQHSSGLQCCGWLRSQRCCFETYLQLKDFLPRTQDAIVVRRLNDGAVFRENQCSWTVSAYLIADGEIR